MGKCNLQAQTQNGRINVLINCGWSCQTWEDVSSIHWGYLPLTSSLRAVTHGLCFDSYNLFINCTWVCPSILKFNEYKVKIAASGQLAIGITIGLVTECCVVKSAYSGHPRFQYLAHSITISGFGQEMRHEMSAWGQVIGFDTIPGFLSPMGLKFSSRGEGRGSAGGSGIVQFAFRVESLSSISQVILLVHQLHNDPSHVTLRQSCRR